MNITNCFFIAGGGVFQRDDGEPLLDNIIAHQLQSYTGLSTEVSNCKQFVDYYTEMAERREDFYRDPQRACPVCIWSRNAQLDVWSAGPFSPWPA